MPSGIIQKPSTGRNPRMPPKTSKTPSPMRIGAEPGTLYFLPFTRTKAKIRSPKSACEAVKSKFSLQLVTKGQNLNNFRVLATISG